MDKKRDRSDYNHKYNVEFMNVLYMRGGVVQSVWKSNGGDSSFENDIE